MQNLTIRLQDLLGFEYLTSLFYSFNLPFQVNWGRRGATDMLTDGFVAISEKFQTKFFSCFLDQETRMRKACLCCFVLFCFPLVHLIFEQFSGCQNSDY